VSSANLNDAGLSNAFNEDVLIATNKEEQPALILPTAAEVSLHIIKKRTAPVATNVTSSPAWSGLAEFSELSAPVSHQVDAPGRVTTAVEPSPRKPSIVPKTAVLPAHELRKAANTKAPAVKQHDLRPGFYLSQQLSTEFCAGALSALSSQSPLAPRHAEAANKDEPADQAQASKLLPIRPPAPSKKPAASQVMQPQEWRGLCHELHGTHPSPPSPSPPARRSRASSSESETKAVRSAAEGKENHAAADHSFGSSSVWSWAGSVRLSH